MIRTIAVGTAVVAPRTGWLVLRCDCGTTRTCDKETARAGGWRVCSGTSIGGSPMRVVICPGCMGNGDAVEPDKGWTAGCRTCHEEVSGEDTGDGPWTEQSAQRWADWHECEKDTWTASGEPS